MGHECHGCLFHHVFVGESCKEDLRCEVKPQFLNAYFFCLTTAIHVGCGFHTFDFRCQFNCQITLELQCACPPAKTANSSALKSSVASIVQELFKERNLLDLCGCVSHKHVERGVAY